MSRLLMLALVLALTSASYATVATLDITVNGQPYQGHGVIASDIIKVVWNTTNPTFGGYAGLNFEISIGDYVEDSFDGIQPPLVIGSDFHIEDRGYGFGVIGGGAGTPFPAGWTFEFEFHMPLGTVYSTIIVLDTLAGGYGGAQAVPGPGDDFPYAELHLTPPEPMTIALLGFGGLFLRRRKTR